MAKLTEIARLEGQIDPQLRVTADGRLERIKPGKGELDYRFVSDRGYQSIGVSKKVAYHWARAFTYNRACFGGSHEYFWVQRRIVGQTDWADDADYPSSPEQRLAARFTASSPDYL